MGGRSTTWLVYLNIFPQLRVVDKQQEVDVPSPKVDDTPTILEGSADLYPNNMVVEGKRKDRRTPMSQISGVRRLTHTNSFTGVVPKYGVESANEEELGKVGEKW